MLLAGQQKHFQQQFFSYTSRSDTFSNLRTLFVACYCPCINLYLQVLLWSSWLLWFGSLQWRNMVLLTLYGGSNNRFIQMMLLGSKWLKTWRSLFFSFFPPSIKNWNIWFVVCFYIYLSCVAFFFFSSIKLSTCIPNSIKINAVSSMLNFLFFIWSSVS